MSPSVACWSIQQVHYGLSDTLAVGYKATISSGIRQSRAWLKLWSCFLGQADCPTFVGLKIGLFCSSLLPAAVDQLTKATHAIQLCQ